MSPKGAPVNGCISETVSNVDPTFHACMSEISFSAKECIRRSGIFSMIVEGNTSDGVACETKTPMLTDSVSWEEVEQEGATRQLLCAFHL